MAQKTRLRFGAAHAGHHSGNALDKADGHPAAGFLVDFAAKEG